MTVVRGDVGAPPTFEVPIDAHRSRLFKGGVVGTAIIEAHALDFVYGCSQINEVFVKHGRVADRNRRVQRVGWRLAIVEPAAPSPERVTWFTTSRMLRRCCCDASTLMVA